MNGCRKCSRKQQIISRVFALLGTSMRPNGKRHSGFRIDANMLENFNKVQMLAYKMRKRQSEKEKVDAPENNDHKTKIDKTPQDVPSKPSKPSKKKRKLTLNETSNGATPDVDISEEDLNANVKTVKDTPSKRQLKREKIEKAEAEKRQTRKENSMQMALDYLSTWKYCRNNWKFEKLKQIWLIDNLLDENAISNNLFPVVLEYFEGCKGMAREVLMHKGMEIIKKAEMEADENDKRMIMKSVAYMRARQLLQTLPTDK